MQAYFKYEKIKTTYELEFESIFTKHIQVKITNSLVVLLWQKMIYDNGTSENINADTNVKVKVFIVPFIVHWFTFI